MYECSNENKCESNSHSKEPREEYVLTWKVYCGLGKGTAGRKLLQTKMETCPTDSMNYRFALQRDGPNSSDFHPSAHQFFHNLNNYSYLSLH